MKLKISQYHFDILQGAISDLLLERPDLVQLYETGQFQNSDRVKDLNMRFRWDMLHCAIGSSWICSNLYSYLDDRHIDSALKKIVPTIVRKY